MRQLFLAVTLVLFLSGCGTSGDGPIAPENRTWTISGETHLLGSVDPLPGVIVKCGSVSTTSGPDGKYILKGVPAGKQTIGATHEDCDPYTYQLNVQSDLNHYVFLVFDGTDLSGTVTNAVEGPISHAKVQLRDLTAYTNASGFYEMGSVRHGIDSLHITHPRFIGATIAVTLAGSSSRYDVRLSRDSTVLFNTGVAKYVYQRTPDVPWNPPFDRMYLGTTGYDSNGNFVNDTRRVLLIQFDFPAFLNNPSVEIVNASLLICTDGAYPSVPFQTYSMGRYWQSDVTYNGMPPPVDSLYGGTIADSTGVKYWSVLDTYGMNKLLTQYRTNGIMYGVMITGGRYQPTGFYSSHYSSAAPPKVRITMRY